MEIGFTIGVIFKTENDIDPDLAWVIVRLAAQDLNKKFQNGDEIEVIEVGEPEL